tara:strand:- start:1133 stop:1546 length:414 start_codon:yes stop_codon:yes gene_type:complete
VSEFLNIYKTFAKVLNDLSLGIDVIPENDDFDPPSAGQWAEFSILSQDITSMGKSGAGDEASGVCQISLYDADTGTLSGVLFALADTISANFTHGTSYTEYGGTAVFINSLSRNTGRIAGAFYQIDLSINWTAYIDR